jgi:hypothetical protein
VGDVLGFVIALAILASVAVPCAMKGRWGLFALGFLGPGVFAWAIGATRLAKPGSAWARRFYGDEQMAEARQRFAERER